MITCSLLECKPSEDIWVQIFLETIPGLFNSIIMVIIPSYIKASINKEATELHLPMQETWVQPLGQEYSPGEGNSYPLHILAWEIPWAEEPAGLQSMGSDTT